jgi:hypothetical protein
VLERLGERGKSQNRPGPLPPVRRVVYMLAHYSGLLDEADHDEPTLRSYVYYNLYIVSEISDKYSN